MAAPEDPLSVIAAENFEFTKASAEAFVGDTMFFRSRNGFACAWLIEAIEGRENAVLSGTWYFKAGGVSAYDADVGICDGY